MFSVIHLGFPIWNYWRLFLDGINSITHEVVLLLRVLKEFKVSWHSLLPFRSARSLSRARLEHNELSGTAISCRSSSAVISGADSRGSSAHPIVLHLELRYIPLPRYRLGVFPFVHKTSNIALKIRSTDYRCILVIRAARDRQMPVLLQGIIGVSVISSRRSLRLDEFFELQVTEITRKSVGSWTRSLWHLLTMLDYVSVRSILPGSHSLERWQVIGSICIIIRIICSRAWNFLRLADCTVIKSTLSRAEVCGLAIRNSWQRINTRFWHFKTESVCSWTRGILLDCYSRGILWIVYFTVKLRCSDVVSYSVNFCLVMTRAWNQVGVQGLWRFVIINSIVKLSSDTKAIDAWFCYFWLVLIANVKIWHKVVWTWWWRLRFFFSFAN